MVFKRRDRRPIWKIVLEGLWPRGGWGRAAQYVKHRLRRLPDSPEKIARGIFAGVFTTFTPFYGMHFVVAALVALAVRGNILAALLGTFFGNPLTYLPIAVISLKTGNFLLGNRRHPAGDDPEWLGRKFLDAAADLKDNLVAFFGDKPADWHNLHRFHDDIFFPYLVGGILPGICAGLVAYYLSVPVIRAYQKRRTSKLRAKLESLRKKAAATADEATKGE
ncbi:hypothetical protein EDD52_11098 [Primorskyibacter sedentarius]|uniref:DUF2062 domain-containing protein n=1 Tax=Primorskyibacter sedentarius TaxID=745311 RepID=A0A4R3J8T8_9RHOB|nr:DUF2062 domain-containing protein [Primorskyibacter sedentarius]TCS61924.1 hypothetical protein EDD52_11098 [Primorskyibacter sedentarius]